MSGASDIKTLMMETVLISETLIYLNSQMQLSGQEKSAELNCVIVQDIQLYSWIWKTFGSNIGWDTVYLEAFLLYFSVSPG
jgi:hypothetical protein